MKILFIGARLFDDVASYASKKGITTILTESNNSAPNIKLADIFYQVSRGMKEPIEIALKEDVDAVVPLIGVDRPLVEVGRMKEYLEKNHQLPVVASPVKAAKIAVNKLDTKKFLMNNKIKTPSYQKISDNDKDITLDQNINFPIVLKPLEGQGGSGQKIVQSKSEFLHYLKNNRTAIAEEFIEGIEISVEVLRWRNKAIPLIPVNKGRTTLEGLHPLDKIKTAPTTIDGLDNDYIRDMALKITNLLGSEGNNDVDMIFDPETKNIYVLEMNTRPSGTRYITTACSDINPMHELVDMASGQWNIINIKKRMKSYYSMEIPILNYNKLEGRYNDFMTKREFSSNNSWIIHGPPAFKRITIRDENANKAFETIKKLGIDYKS
ncbi:MAG: ATP-grasp domain-containing protein [Methanobacteriaceae archaeon]|nr:ATP-grasp domain-containing protein [Methanobacteriaceae archaeon]